MITFLIWQFVLVLLYCMFLFIAGQRRQYDRGFHDVAIVLLPW